MHTHDDLQKQQIMQLNQAIGIGLAQLQSGNKRLASESYHRLKEKINHIAGST